MEGITRKNQDLESTLPLTISAQYGLIDQNEFFDKRIASKDVSGYFLVRKGEFAYNKSTSSDTPWGAIKRLDRYKNGVLSTLYIVFKIMNEESTNSDFLVTYYDTDRWHKGIQAIAAEGARNHGLLNIAPVDFFETTLSLPQDIDEQRKIGEYFKQLNDLITLHQRKLDRLKQMKQGYLQLMFPRNGESVPRLRFANFEGGWKQRKLGELVDTVKSYSLSREVETDEPTGYRYIHYGDIHKKIADLIESDKQLPIIQGGSYELLQQGDIVVADASEDYVGIAEPSILLERPTDRVVAGLHTIAMRPQEICPLFLYYLLHTEEFKRFGSRVGTGMKVFGITIKNLYRFATLFPEKEEQIKIGNFFKQFDNTIILYQAKLDKLKSLKKAYLQKMFI
ncbi:type I restriction enzyme S subunit [Mobilisporobacter senegalensis]|uniref:Type I restriction enzyme S subunit n=1 Tax=Mobilisporobacter senegalensis TaxID=1329262 RepID=A0A3N1XGM3_9FIRM|nr:restriction endonuclease subunit S [Mobilisporobacter senegalensis]ROR25869.1 type I restriction enzyme S subunit [Mobilisporobacter senegalensis]